MTIVYDEEGTQLDLPFKWEICPICNGHGKSSAYLGAFTQEDLAQKGPEFLEEYMAGAYDRACAACENGKVKVVDYDRLSPEHKELYEQAVKDDYYYDGMRAMERLMGA